MTRIDWRVVGYGIAGYVTAWVIVGYIAIITLIGGPLDVRPLIQLALMATPTGALFGVLAGLLATLMTRGDVITILVGATVIVAILVFYNTVGR